MSSAAQPVVEAPVAPEALPNFEDMLGLEKEILTAGEPEPGGEAPPVVEPTPPPAPAPEPAPVPPAEEPPKPAEAPPEVKPPEPPKPPEAPQMPTPEQVAEQRKAALAQIAGRFAFSEEDREKLISEPHEVLPKLAAELQLSTYEMIMGAMHGLLPQMITRQIADLSHQQAGSNKFFERWPGLKDPKHHEIVRKVSTAYRAAFPDATMEQAIEDIGAMAMRRAGLSPAAASSPPKEKPNSPPPSRPFAPAGTGAAAPPSRPQASSDEKKMWAELVED